jgi:imidazolonepropionase
MIKRGGENLLIRHCGELVTMNGPVPRRGDEMEDLGVAHDVSVLIVGGRVACVGNTRQVGRKARSLGEDFSEIDAEGRLVTPGLVDNHTHPVFAATREVEFEMRVRGSSYEEIAEAGGGILNSARALRQTSDRALRRFSRGNFDEMLSWGTTTLEAKSGYGLTTRDELRILRSIRAIARDGVQNVVPTLLAAHALPREYRGRKRAYVEHVCRMVIPQAARRRLAYFVDVFVESVAFSKADAKKIAVAAREHGLGVRLHVDQLADGGGASLAVRLGADSADHLEHVSRAGVRALARSGTVATLLPASVLFLGKSDYPPARSLIDAGAVVALATDFNPGSSMTGSLPLVMSLACTMMRMTPAEALSACTANAAFSLGLTGRVGQIVKGARGDIAIWDLDDHRGIPYHMGMRKIWKVITGGTVVFEEDV